MSRSYKRNNWTGYSCAESDKDWKRSNNRRFRRKETMCVDEDDFDKIEDVRVTSDPWSSAKDGKTLWEPDFWEPEKRRKYFNRKGKLRK